jgi:hypothetical protein
VTQQRTTEGPARVRVAVVRIEAGRACDWVTALNRSAGSAEGRGLTYPSLGLEAANSARRYADAGNPSMGEALLAAAFAYLEIAALDRRGDRTSLGEELPRARAWVADRVRSELAAAGLADAAESYRPCWEAAASPRAPQGPSGVPGVSTVGNVLARSR